MTKLETDPQAQLETKLQFLTPEQQSLVDPFKELLLASLAYRIKFEQIIYDRAANSGFFREIVGGSGSNLLPDGILVQVYRGCLKSKNEILKELEHIARAMYLPTEIWRSGSDNEGLVPATPAEITALNDLMGKVYKVLGEQGFITQNT